MSYNPSAWHVRRIEELWLDIGVLKREGFRVTAELSSDGTIGSPKVVPVDEFSFFEIELSETDIEGGSVLVSKIKWDGEMYRDDYEKIQAVLASSVGFIEYVLVWESGDSVEIVTYTDGIVEVETIV